jgi:hypothetical protein
MMTRIVKKKKMMTKGSQEVAKLCSVHYNKLDDDSDEVLVTFRVVDDAYKKLVLQVARRDDIELVISGERLYVASKESK